jgi:hypothetical protein
VNTFPYTATEPPPAESSEQLRARIPGWGVDLDPADRPSVPRQRPEPELLGAHWDLPERQPEERPRERSIEHGMLPPVFGTSCPTHGVSGAIRRLAYRRYSEGRAAHWLLLLAADRVDVAGSVGASLLHGRPELPVVETGLRSEVTSHGFASRRGQNRTDVIHHPVDPVVVAAPWVLAGYGAYRVTRGIARRGRRRSPVG